MGQSLLEVLWRRWSREFARRGRRIKDAGLFSLPLCLIPGSWTARGERANSRIRRSQKSASTRGRHYRCLQIKNLRNKTLAQARAADIGAQKAAWRHGMSVFLQNCWYKTQINAPKAKWEYQILNKVGNDNCFYLHSEQSNWDPTVQAVNCENSWECL